jgi:hypothetical protein
MKSMRINLLRIGFLVLATLGFSSLASAGEGLFSPADLPKAKQAYSPDSQCVEPVEVMRRWHMEFIRHQRDKTMHQGIRTSKHSLVGCIDCHVSPGADIHSKEHFCTACHSYAAVRVDCFQCHAGTPQLEAVAPPPVPPAAPAVTQPETIIPAPTAGGSQP